MPRSAALVPWSGRFLLLGGSLLGTAVLIAIGVAYAANPDSTVPPPEPVGWFLATMAFVGAILLGAVGTWQSKAAGGTRVLFLVLGALLTAVWIGASTLALLADGQGPPDVPQAMHWVGLTTSCFLFALWILEGTQAAGELQPRG